MTKTPFLSYTMALELYSWLSTVAAYGIGAPWLLGRILVGKASYQEFQERIGWRFTSPPPSSRPHVVFHAVSVGELTVAESIVTQLLARIPDLDLTLTTGTRDGLKRAQQILRNLPSSSHRTMFLPWDHPKAIRKFLNSQAPQLLVTVETEIWPLLFHECSLRNIPVCIVNGRIYPKDQSSYQLLGRFMRGVLENTAWIGVQSEEERNRFLAIGASPNKIEVIGNAKYDVIKPPVSVTDQLLSTTTPLPIIVAGSTHHPEECWLLDAFQALPDTTRLIIAPRHPHRARHLLRLAKQRGFNSQLWSCLNKEKVPWRILIMDEIGILPTLYAKASIAYIGGSLVERGGHNPLEATAAGCPVVFGPHMENFQDIARDLIKVGAAITLENRQDLPDVFGQLLANPDIAEHRGMQGKILISKRQGSAIQYSTRLANHL